jgi:hypothetical protein
MSERRAVVYLGDVLAKVDSHVGRDIRYPLIEALEALPDAAKELAEGSATVRVADVLSAALDTLSDEDYARFAARIDALSAVAVADPDRVYTEDDMELLIIRGARIIALGTALMRARQERADPMRVHDGDTRAAAEGRVQAAARALAAVAR